MKNLIEDLNTPGSKERFGAKIPDHMDASLFDGMVADVSHINTQLIWWKIPER